MRNSPVSVAASSASAHNPVVPITAWQRRLKRAETLTRQHPFATEILSFYSTLVRFQEGLYEQLAGATNAQEAFAAWATGPPEVLTGRFGEFLSGVKKNAPAGLCEAANELHEQPLERRSQLLNDIWLSSNTSPAHPAQFLARAFLQPYAEWLRSWTDGNAQSSPSLRSLCPFCNRKPGLGILRQQGDGGRRSLLCSFCLAEWEFRRIVCPACAEEDNSMLPVYTAEEFDYIRVECCDTCKTYIKAINLTRNGLAEPVVDELASAPLDLWARDHGYAKLELNLIGM